MLKKWVFSSIYMVFMAKAAVANSALIVRQRKEVDAAPGTDADTAVFHNCLLYTSDAADD